MAKIVGYDSKYLFTGTCSSCCAIIECTESETTERTHYNYGGGSEKYRTVVCPNDRCINHAVEVFRKR